MVWITSSTTYFIYFSKIVCISRLFTQFIFHLEGRSIPTICGTNNGAHLYVDFPSDMITMFINTSGKDKLIFHINQVKICTLKPWCTEYGNFFQEKFETWVRVCWLLLISVWKQAGNKLRRALSPPLNASLLPILYKLIYRPVVCPRL